MTSLDGMGFATDPLDRATDRRENAEAVAAFRARADARAILIARDMPVLMKTGGGLDALLPVGEIAAFGGARVEALLGILPDGAPVFAALLPDEAVVEESDGSDGFLDRRVLVAPGRDDLKLVDLRSLAAGGLVPPEQASMLASAKALMSWHARRRYCSNCGQPSDAATAGWRRECRTCGMQHFPRTDPVVIMLAVDGDDCLLGRQPRFPRGMYSALAGFVEPGETIEAAVRREIREEFRRRVRRGPLFRVPALAVPLLADDRLLRAGAEPRGHDRPDGARGRALVLARRDAGAPRKAASGQARRPDSDGDRASPDQAMGARGCRVQWTCGRFCAVVGLAPI